MRQRIPPEVAAQVARLFVEESGAVYRAALRAAHGDRTTADLAVQEAFQAAALNWGTIAGFSPARRRAWLCRVAINKAIDQYRLARPMRLVADVKVERAEASVEQIALTRIAKDRCLQVIKKMPAVRRNVAYLRWHEEWTMKEIAEYLGIAESTVRVHLHDARVMLEEAVADEMPFAREPDDTHNAGREEER